MKKRITRKTKLRACKSIALVLSLCLLLQTVALADDVIPNSTAEVDTSAPATEVEAVEENEEIDISDLEIVSEDESKRGEAEKHFLCEDGSFVAISYGSPVHYEDEDGNWQEIDNTLEITTVDGVTAYTNADGLFDVELSPSGEDIVTIEKDGYTVSFDVTAKTDASLIAEKILDNKLPEAYVSALFTKTEVVSGGTLSPIKETGAALNEAPVDTRITAVNGIIESYNLQDKAVTFAPKEAEIKETDTSLWSQAERLTTLTKTNSQISFAEAFEEEIDVEYILTPTQLKENIILNSASDITSYETRLNANSLTAILQADKSIELKNSQNEVIFTVSAPYMYDSAESESYDFEVTLQVLEAGEYIITYIPSIEWLSSEDRVYPITVDPTVTVNSNRGHAVDTYVVQGETTQSHYNSGNLYVGIKSDGKKVATYLKFDIRAMPSIPTGAEIDDARINIFIDPQYNTNGYPINAYRCTSSWGVSTVLYGTSVSTELIESNITVRTNSNGKRYYSISYKEDVVEGYSYYWATGSVNTGYGVKLETTQTASGNIDCLTSNEDGVNTTYRPFFWIRYQAPTDANIADGIYYIENVNANKPLSIANTTAVSTEAGLYSYTNYACQRWNFVKQSNGYYTIESATPAMANYYLTLSSNSTVAGNGSYVYARYFDGTLPANAYWKVYINDDGTYRIANRSYLSRVLDCEDGGTANYTAVQTYEYVEPGNDNQKWRIAPYVDNIGYMGYAVYRDGVALLEWHAAIACDVKSLADDKPIIHIAGSTHTVDESSWVDFLNDKNYMGLYKPEGTLSYAQKFAVVETARELTRQNIEYTLLGQIEVDVDAMNGSTKIEPQHILRLRCDGVVEYCYEYHGIEIYGGDSWDISDVANLDTHAGLDAIITPRIQAEQYMVKITNDLPY